MTVMISVECPYCNSTEVVKMGFTEQNKQRYRCDNNKCKRKTFILDYKNKGYLPTIKDQIIDMSLNGSGVRDITRVLGVSIGLVINEIKKSLQFKESKLGQVIKKR